MSAAAPVAGFEPVMKPPSGGGGAPVPVDGPVGLNHSPASAERDWGKTAVIIHYLITTIALLSLAIINIVYLHDAMPGMLHSKISLGFSAAALFSGLIASAAGPVHARKAAITTVVMLIFTVLFACSTGKVLHHDIPAITMWCTVTLLLVVLRCSSCH